MPRRKPSPEPTPKKRASGPSGPTQSADARRAAGRVRWELWIDSAIATRFDARRGERTRREAVEAALVLVMGGDRS